MATNAVDEVGETRQTGLFARVRSGLFWRSEEDNIDGLIRSYGNSLYIAARGLTTEPGDIFDQMAARILSELAKPSLNFREIMAIENQMSRLYPPEVKRRRNWEYRQRFEKVASPSELSAYLASGPPAPPSAVEDAGAAATPVEVYDADNIVLLEHVHKNYLITLLREQAVRDLKRWIQFGLLRSGLAYGMAILVLIWLTARGTIGEQVQYFCIGLFLLYLIGRVGAAMSVIQRLQKAVKEPGRDPIFEVTAICTGRRSISIAMLSGGVFAILIYVIFAAGLGQNLGMSGGIFPQVQTDSPADQFPQAGSGTSEQPQQGGRAAAAPTTDTAAGVAAAAPRARENAAATPAPPSTNSIWHRRCRQGSDNCVPVFVSEIGKHLGFRDYPDFFKMLLLAFLAGFAERLVPDALDRLIKKEGDGSERSNSSAVTAGS